MGTLLFSLEKSPRERERETEKEREKEKEIVSLTLSKVLVQERLYHELHQQSIVVQIEYYLQAIFIIVVVVL